MRSSHSSRVAVQVSPRTAKRTEPCRYSSANSAHSPPALFRVIIGRQSAVRCRKRSGKIFPRPFRKFGNEREFARGGSPFRVGAGQREIHWDRRKEQQRGYSRTNGREESKDRRKRYPRCKPRGQQRYAFPRRRIRFPFEQFFARRHTHAGRSNGNGGDQSAIRQICRGDDRPASRLRRFGRCANGSARGKQQSGDLGQKSDYHRRRIAQGGGERDENERNNGYKRAHRVHDRGECSGRRNAGSRAFRRKRCARFCADKAGTVCLLSSTFPLANNRPRKSAARLRERRCLNCGSPRGRLREGRD